MIFEFLEYLTTDCPRYARRLGYLKEAIAIRARQGRLGAAWEPHLENSKEVIREAMERCDRRRTALVLGSGLLLDIPLDSLAGTFETVRLVDVVHLRPARRQASAYPNVVLETQDVSGMAADFQQRYREGWRGHPVPAPTAFLDDSQIDLLVSANLMAQLPIFPAAMLVRRGALDGDAFDRFCRAVMQAHLDYLRSFDAPACLITETRREALDRAGNSVQAHDALYGIRLPKGGREWDWDLAPLGEVSRDHALRNRVAGFCDISAQADSV